MTSFTFYKLTDIDRLEDIRAWVMDRDNHGQLVESAGRYTVVIVQNPGMTDRRGVFEAQFGSSVESYIPE